MLNKTVRHKTFGSGTICEMAEDIVTVRFGSQERRFPYPDAFREHLVLSEATAREKLQDVLDLQDEARLALEEEKRRLEERERLFRRLPLHESAQAAFGFAQNDPKEVEKTWTLSAGRILTGFNRGQPRVPQRLYPNSACLLTGLPKGEPEEARCIWGAFMVTEDFVGPECADGLIPAHPAYRLVLNKKDREKFRFWPYFAREGGPEPSKWGAVEIKYFSNRTMARILRDIAALERDPGRQEKARDFLVYFCDRNKLSVPDIG